MDKVLERILSLMSKRYPSDAAFEIDLGLKPKSVYEWKRGKSKWYKDNIETVAKCLDVSPAYLMGWEDKPEGDDPDAPYQLVGHGLIGGARLVDTPKHAKISEIRFYLEQLDEVQLETVLQFVKFTAEQK